MKFLFLRNTQKRWCLKLILRWIMDLYVGWEDQLWGVCNHDEEGNDRKCWFATKMKSKLFLLRYKYEGNNMFCIHLYAYNISIPTVSVEEGLFNFIFLSFFYIIVVNVNQTSRWHKGNAYLTVEGSQANQVTLNSKYLLVHWVVSV